jgi:dipeptidyl aminopeptidase/acylaminoacyl peptidase
MTRRILSILAAAVAVFCPVCKVAAQAKDTLVVKEFRYLGPFATAKPFIMDSTDAAGKTFDLKEAELSQNISLEGLKKAAVTGNLPVKSDDLQVHIAGFSIENSGFAKADLVYSGPMSHQLFLDGKKLDAPSLKLEPGSHFLAVKYLTDTTAAEPFKISLSSASALKVNTDGDRIYSLDINTQGIGCNRAELSPSGKYYLISATLIRDNGDREQYSEVYETANNRLITRLEKGAGWMPSSDRYYFTENGLSGKRIMVVDPGNLSKTVLAENIPDGNFAISPTEDFAIFTMETQGPKEGDVHQILTPDDRQPGWRNRSHVARFDFATGRLQRLTFGYHSAWMNDISRDGRYLLFATYRNDLSKRPTTMMSILRMDLQTMAVDTLVKDDGFVSGATFSADGRRIAVIGSPEAFGKIGQVLPEGRIANMYDYQLYVVDVATKAVKPLTKEFAPSVKNVDWSASDGKIYISADDKDCINLYRIDPDTGKIERLDNQEDYLYCFSVSQKTPQLIYAGQSLCSADRVWLMNTKKNKNTLVADFNAQRLDGVNMGEGGEYEFTSSRGDLINGFYVLPPDFDASKKYPLLVHYYGGCSPSARYCVGSYSPQYYAAQGYIFYVVNPSGASGFGQEFASRHVNTAGQGVAEDILEAVESFCKDHPYVDRKHIGCFSASYGGFMTQLLLAKSDIFAAGISHAGISDHTSYWGEGYWGYSYSEVSMANSFPWNAKDLYVDNSPLYMADKIHTPLLFLHGSADTNVPIGESIQMFTALKLLGCDTAFVVVDGENHGIRDYAKRRQWLRTISAWFAKYLKEDSSWWDELYPEKAL